MNVVKFFKMQVEEWNEIEKCGFCWEYDAPLTNSGVNESDTENPCCVKVMVANLEIGQNREYNPTTGFLRNFTQDHTFDLHILHPDVIGTNVYSEKLGHPLEESKHEKIIEPLRKCITPENILEFCKFLGFQAKITAWRAFVRINWLDGNYTGWTIRMTIRTDGSEIQEEEINEN